MSAVGAMLMTMEPPRDAPQATVTPRDLRCKRRACDTLLARVIGVTLVCLDGTRVGPVVRGMVVSRKCPRCGAVTNKWL